MKSQHFDKLARTAFGNILNEAGFRSDKSRHCTFYREVTSGFYHIVLPDLGTRGAWYDVKVFAISELLDPRFTVRFPDDLGIPTDLFCYLAFSGVGPDQAQFSCKSEDSFTQRFESTVAPLLTSVALPYLDRFQSLEDLLPEIRNPLYRAIATHHVKGIASSQPLLEQQRERLDSLNSSDENVLATLRLIGDLLSMPA